MSSTVVPRREVWDPRQTILKFQTSADEDDPRTLTVPAAYDAFLLPYQHRNSDAQRSKYDTILGHWKEFAGSTTIGQMDGNDLKMLAFQNWLVDVQRIAPGTANRYCTYIVSILKVCGRRDGRNKRGKNIIRDVPFVDPLEFVPKRPVNATLAQLDRLYVAASVAEWPDSRVLPAPLWWRVLFVLSFTYGPRTEDLAPIKRKGDGLSWEAVRKSPGCPVEELELDYPLGWLVYLPGKTKRKKGELVLPQTAVVKKHLDALPHSSNHGAKPGSSLLPCITHYEDFLDQRKAIEKAAGLEGRSITLQTVRRSCQSYWDKVSLLGRGEKERSLLGNYITGHSARGVSAEFYREPLVLLVEPDDRGEKLIDRFRYPESFLKGP
jgi:hypothetical protein